MRNFIGSVALAAIFVLSLSSFKSAPNENNLAQIVQNCDAYATHSASAETHDSYESWKDAYDWYLNYCENANGSALEPVVTKTKAPGQP